MIRDTSIETYRAVIESGYVGKRQKEVYSGVYNNQGCTANELWQVIGGSKRNVQANIHARLNELKKMGLIEELAQRRCRVTGHLAHPVRTTNNGPPTSRLRSDQIRCSYCNGKGYVEQGRLL